MLDHGTGSALGPSVPDRPGLRFGAGMERAAVGRVPRTDLGRIEGRLRAVEQAIRDAEQDRWARSNPQARARAEDAVTQLETTIENLRKRLDKARAAGDTRAMNDAEQAITAREEWLAQARQALADFGG